MSPLPVEQSGESPAAAGDTKSYLPTPFLTKTYQLVEDSSLNEMISWNDDGTTFIVWRPAEFARDLLPKYFKHNNFSSFVRQLNTYGFRKVIPDRWEFSNDFFRRGEKALLRDIQRRKIPSPAAAAATVAVPLAAQSASPANSGDEQVLSSSSSLEANRSVAANAPELAEENDRLRRENSRLLVELGRLRGVCDSVMSVMTSFNSDPEGRQTDPMPERGEREGEAMSPRLFGVSIGVKRVRLNGDDHRREIE